ncbi:hypothetical protein DSO57_1020894 [Entomophthora muscae]|uniref:Uncharacterized protein n=1 Tax=Entomophthora muscae TaxID=34485 RepID=A0ACC2TR28_9FUNG|nr:hypothetical protein DSO57_1020894 [Entomophthora muscae]
MDIATKKSMVNELDELILIFLDSCCSPALENVAQTVLESRDPDLTSEDDAVAYFTSVFSQPDVCLQGLSDHLSAIIGSFCAELFSYFSAANVKTHIVHYPKSVSCVLTQCTLISLKLYFLLV